MHTQIRSVIKGLRWPGAGMVQLELTAGEHTPLGRLVGRLYYQTGVMDLVDKDTRWGFPHNGGQHTFGFEGSRRDAVAMLEIFKEALEVFKLTEEESQVASELSYISQDIISGPPKI